MSERIQKNVVKYSVPILFSLAFLIRILILNSCCLGIGETESDGYVKTARILASGEITYGIHKAPTFTVYMTSFFKMFGENFDLFRIFNVILSSFSVLLTFFIGKLVFNHPIGFIAGVFQCLNPRDIFWTRHLLGETLYVFLVLSLVYILLLTVRKQTIGLVILSGLVLVLGIFNKGTLYAFIPFIIIWMLYYIKSNRLKAIYLSLGIYLIFGVFYLGWKAFMFNQFGEFSLLPERTGQAVYSGVTGYNDSKLKNVTEIIKDDEIQAKKLDSLTLNKGINYYKENPKALLISMAKKMTIFWRPFPRNALNSQKIIGFISFFPLFVFSIISLFYLEEQWKDVSLFIILILTFNFIHLIFTVHGRYRLPLEPLIAILAAFTILLLYTRVTNKAKVK